MEETTETKRAVVVSEVASRTHERWLAMADRSYSPFNKPWAELSREAQAHVAIPIAVALQSITDAGYFVPWVDDLGCEAEALPSPPEIIASEQGEPLPD